MKLLAFMKVKGLDDAAMAALTGGCTPQQIRKWKYGERKPKLAMILKISEATDNLVCLIDFLDSLEHSIVRVAS